MSKKTKRVDELLKEAKLSLSRQSAFEAERMASKALLMAHQARDFARMADAAGQLGAIRRTRREMALKVKAISIIDRSVTDTMEFEPGCYLVEPPQVGADARRLRLAALQREIPVAVVCREPLTQTGLWPIVAIGAGTTVRTKVKPPRNPSKPDKQWFTNAMEAIGDWAIDMIDPALELTRRIDVLMERLDTIPDHDRLHQELEAACREAAECETSAAREGGSSKRGRKSRIKS